MRHFVAYHSEDRMGYSAEEINPFGLYTKKNISSTGDKVWIIAGVGASPKQYFLSSWFVIKKVTEAEHTDFEFQLHGEEGEAFDPMLRLDQMPWFPAFRQRMANFSIGLTQLDPTVITALQQAVAEAGQPKA